MVLTESTDVYLRSLRKYEETQYHQQQRVREPLVAAAKDFLENEQGEVRNFGCNFPVGLHLAVMCHTRPLTQVPCSELDSIVLQ